MNRATASKGRSDVKCFRLWIALAVLAGLGLPRSSKGAAEPGPAPDEITVAVQEIPVWEIASEQVRNEFLSGQHTSVRKTEYPAAKYPKFTSETPLYGQAGFPNVARGSRRSGSFTVFALDCALKGGYYDLLYFDDNGDGDLTNDRPRNPLQESDKLVRRSTSFQEVYFEPVQVTFDFGPGGARPLELLPHLRAYRGDNPQFSFVAARVRTGTFTIGNTTYQAVLGYQYTVGGPLDQPSTTLILAPQGGDPVYWWGGDELRATHRLGGRLYRFSSTPAGDKLSVRPYTGPVGTLEVGAAGRKVETLEMSGSLSSKETAVAVGDTSADGWPKPSRRCEIPVGDYYPRFMTITLDNIRLVVSNNYHMNAQGEPRDKHETVHGITIRPDKPYVLDFSNKPAVVFTQPAAGARGAPGAEITVKAVLVDPKLDIMIRGLNDMATMEKRSFKTPDGKEHTYEQAKSLDPKVTIARANGEIVAEGVMPFG
jgi:hypothetical protein